MAAMLALLLPITSANILSSLDVAREQRFDAILVLGGGAPPAHDVQLPFVAERCKAAAAIWRAAEGPKPKILTLSAGTAHVPQLLDARGSVVFEATASAAVIIGAGVDEKDVFVETTSFDTIGNAYFSRTDHCSLAGWRRLLVITSDFHLARTRAIFEWVYSAAGAEPTGAFELSFLGTKDAGLTEPEVAARTAREEASARNIRLSLAPGHRTLASVRAFLTSRHDLYSAKGLVARAARPAGGEDAAWAKSYGSVSPGAAAPAVLAVSGETAAPAGGYEAAPPDTVTRPCGYSLAFVLFAFAVGAFLGNRGQKSRYRTY